MINNFEAMLTGGHPNSLGRTEDVVAEILKDKQKLQALYDCYRSEDAVVRLRVSSAMKQLTKARPEWVIAYIDRLESEISNLDQPSAKWSLAQIFMWLGQRLTEPQRIRAIEIMKHNLLHEKDWIVQCMTAESLVYFAKNDPTLKNWLRPQLQNMSNDTRKTVARKAAALLTSI